MSDRKQRKNSSLKTRWIPSTNHIGCVVVICVVAIWSGLPARVLEEPTRWTQKDYAEEPYMFVYLFNWTNMYDPGNANVKPNFVQLGPYVLRADVRWTDNSTQTWSFEKQMSIGALDDLISIFHPPDPIVANRIRRWNQFMKKVVYFTLNAEVGCMAMKSWVFEGHYDPLTEAAMLLHSELIPWSFREHSTHSDKVSNFEVNLNESFYHGLCLTEGPLDMLGSGGEMRGNHTKISGMGVEEFFSDDDILEILKDINEYYVPFVVVTERVRVNQMLDLLQKFTSFWLDSYWLVFGTIALLFLIGGAKLQTKNLSVLPNRC